MCCHYVKSVRIRSFPGPYFPPFGLKRRDKEYFHSECGKIRTRKTPNTDTFHAVCSGQVPPLENVSFSKFVSQ